MGALRLTLGAEDRADGALRLTLGAEDRDRGALRLMLGAEDRAGGALRVTVVGAGPPLRVVLVAVVAGAAVVRGLREFAPGDGARVTVRFVGVTVRVRAGLLRDVLQFRGPDEGVSVEMTCRRAEVSTRGGVNAVLRVARVGARWAVVLRPELTVLPDSPGTGVRVGAVRADVLAELCGWRHVRDGRVSERRLDVAVVLLVDRLDRAAVMSRFAVVLDGIRRD